MLWQLIHPSPAKVASPSCTLDGASDHWYALRKVDVVAIHDPYADEYIVLRRDRKKCFGFLARGLWLTLRLLSRNGRTVRKWRAGSKQLTEIQFWHKYLGMTAAEKPKADPIRNRNVVNRCPVGSSAAHSPHQA